MMQKRKPNKPDDPMPGEDAEAGEEKAAVRNQSVVSPDDYPDSDGGKPDYGSPPGKSGNRGKN